MGLTGRNGVLNQWTVIMLIYTSVCQSQKTTKTVVITAEEEKLRDPHGYAAIVELHKQMDVDESGDIDRAESKGFIGMNDIGGSDRVKREMAFHHGNDDKVDVEELWESWFASNVRSWTTSELAAWMEHTVKMPQYSDAIVSQGIDGRSLPRMALLNSSFLTDTLGVKSYKDKKKLVIKALDLVLFGMAEDGASKVKDIALSVLAVLLLTVLLVFRKQLKRSRTEMETLSKKLTQLKTMESDFEEAQKKFEEEHKRRQSASDAVALENEQVATLRSQLIEAERLLESNNSAPLALQPLLRRTCELEMSYIGQQRLECIAEMSEAIELIEKLRKKQSGIISSIKLATGASAGTDQVDSRIFSLKARMEKISITMGECQRRWIEIESLCGFPIILQTAGSAPVAAASICSTSSTESRALTGSVGSLLSEKAARPARVITRAVVTPASYSSMQSASNGTVIPGHRSTSYQMHSASSDDLHIRSLAQLPRHQRQSAASTTPSESCSLHGTMQQRQFETEPIEDEEVNSYQFKHEEQLPSHHFKHEEQLPSHHFKHEEQLPSHHFKHEEQLPSHHFKHEEQLPSHHFKHEEQLPSHHFKHEELPSHQIKTEELTSHQSNSSICSTSSNDDEKENGTQDNRKASGRTVPKKMKFHLFRRAKYSA